MQISPPAVNNQLHVFTLTNGQQIQIRVDDDAIHVAAISSRSGLAVMPITNNIVKIKSVAGGAKYNQGSASS